MQVTELESQGLKKSFKIVVDSAQINTQLESELRVAGERVKIPGFRPGYIPMNILKQRYGASVQADVLKKVINQASTDLIKEKKLRPALTPQVNIEEYKEEEGLTFTMTFETFPEIPDIAYDKITLDRKTFEITEADIDAAQDRIAERSPKLVRAEEGVKATDGSVVTIDFKGMINGKQFKGGAASDFRLELGSKQFIEGFEDQLIGVKEGDSTDVKVTFPDDYPGEEVSGKDAVFMVKVKEIHNKETPEIDDEFSRARGFASLEAFRDAIRTQLVREYDQVVRGQLKKELFDYLENEYNFEPPQGMVDLEFNSIWERLKQAQAQGDESVAGKDEEELKTEYQSIAKRRVKLGLLLAEVGTRNKIQIKREEITRAVMEQANMFPGQEKKVMEFYRNNPERVDDLRGPILEEKAVDFVLEKVKYNDTKASLEDLVAEDEDESGDSEKKKKPAQAKKSAKSSDESEKKAPAKKKAAK